MGTKGAPQVRGYAAEAAALSGIPANMKTTTKKKLAPPKRNKRWASVDPVQTLIVGNYGLSNQRGYCGLMRNILDTYYEGV